MSASARAADVEEITVDELEELLARGDPVTVFDIRPTDQRDEWWIPGSVHIDAYGSFDANDPGPLAGFEPDGDGPIVTVCARGRSSAVAARHLADRGLDVRSLAGGMRAWGLAANAASLDVGGGVEVVQLRRTGKGCLSYLVGAPSGEAFVVDPALPPERFLEEASARGWEVGHVLETHVHADHLSRARALAEAADAVLHLPDQDRVAHPFEPLRDGDRLEVGGVAVAALGVPGHTPESTAFLVDDRALLTGDTLFLDGVGRPDLEAGSEGARARALDLHASLRRLLALDGDTWVLPGHTDRPVPFDGQPVADRLQAVRSRLDLAPDPEAFADRLVERLPPPPANHAEIVAHNEAGTRPKEPLDLEAGANRCAVA